MQYMMLIEYNLYFCRCKKSENEEHHSKSAERAR